MKILSIITILLFSMASMAVDEIAEPIIEPSGDAFITCMGYEQGSRLDFYSNEDGSEVTIAVSRPEELEEGQMWPLYMVTEILKGEKALENTDYNLTLSEVVDVMMDETNEKTYEFVRVHAAGPDESMLVLNLENSAGESYLVLDGVVEPLSCQLIQH